MLRKFLFIFDSDPLEEEFGKSLKKYNNLNDLIGILILVLISIFIVILLVYYLYVNKKEVEFYTINLKTKQIQSIYVYDTPITSVKNIINWGEKASKEIFSFNFLNYKEKLVNNKIYFSANGYNTFKTFFDESPLLNEVIKNKLEVSLTPIDTPVIVNSYKSMSGKKNWVLETPVYISYSGANPTYSRKFYLVLIIEEANTETYQSGVYITSLRLVS